MSIPIYVSKTYFATSRGKALRAVRCEQCDGQFYYWLSRSVQGTAEAPYFLGGDSAARKAREEAAKLLDKSLSKHHDVVPCPHCGHVQQAMIRHARSGMYNGIWSLALVLLILGPIYTIIGLIDLSSGSSNRRGQENASSFWWIPGAIGAVGGLCLLLVRRLMISKRTSTGQWLDGLIALCPPALILAGKRYERFQDRLRTVPRKIVAEDQQEGEWVNVPWLRITLPMICIECLQPATTVFRCPFKGKEKSQTPMPLCADCRARIDRLWHRNRALVVLGSIVAATGLALMPIPMAVAARFFIAIFISIVLAALLTEFLPAMLTRPFQMKSIDEERSIYRMRFRNPRYTQLLREVVASAEAPADQAAGIAATVKT